MNSNSLFNLINGGSGASNGDTGSVREKKAYWPGHIVAECLVDESESGTSNANRRVGAELSNKATVSRKNSRKNSTDGANENRSNRANFIATKLKPGCSFSAIINSMLPVDMLIKTSKEEVASKFMSEIQTSTGVDAENTNSDEFVYDEFGFKVEKEEKMSSESRETIGKEEGARFVNISLSASPSSIAKRMLTEAPYVEDSKHKLKWIAYLEFTLNADVGSSFSWDQVTTLNKCEKLRAMIRGQGVPHSLRPFIWMRSSGALSKKLKAQLKYGELLKNAENEHLHTSRQIEKDLLRTLPSNACFSTANSVGIPRLRRILQTLAWIYPNIGYCQGMGTIVACLLLFLEEEDAFWLMCTIIEDILPGSYYSHTLIGVQTDMKVLGQLIGTYLPEIDQQFKKHDIELSLICINWFLTIFSNVLHIRILLRVWDLFFYEGSSVLFQITLAMLKLNEKELLDAQSSAHIFTILTDIPGEACDIDSLVETSIRIASSVNKNLLDSIRRKHHAYLMAQNGSFIMNPFVKEKAQMRDKSIDLNAINTSQTKKGLFKLFKKSNLNEAANGSSNGVSGTGNGSPDERLTDINNNENSINSNFRSSVKSVSSSAAHSREHNDSISDESSDPSMKIKNILQTEFLINLRETILKIVHHFQKFDAEMYSSCTLNADYSIESHARDYETYMDTTRVRKFKRAKALLDFEKTDEDELGFHKNDIITVLSTKDEHCWIGEINDEKGWFPSRFVSLIDERNGKVYSPAGDDSVNENIRDLIRGEFSRIIKSIFEHGLKKWKVLGGVMHPWSFIEEAAKKSVEKDFNSVYSRLVLCKTYRLDEDSKVLTPDELLFKSIQLINMTHDKYKAQMDVKFRSLICIGLNEQVLHIWLETLCSSMETVEKWYHQWSFLRSPGWVQIKCEFRLLSQFSFNLNPDAELPDSGGKEAAMNECIQDMLIKHHLFSWDLN
jgi:hypothetical protein